MVGGHLDDGRHREDCLVVEVEADLLVGIGLEEMEFAEHEVAECEEEEEEEDGLVDEVAARR